MAKKRVCVKCKWFLQPWNSGKSCKDMGKKPSDVCDEFEAKSAGSEGVINSIDDIYEKDKRVRKLLSEFSPKPDKYFDNIYKELKKYYLFRKTLKVDTAISFRKLVVLFNRCQAYCNRVTALMVDCVRYTAKCEERVEFLRAYLFATYGDMLYAMRATDRKEFLDTITQPIRLDIQRHSSLHKALKLVYDDLVQTHWTLTKLKELAEAIRDTEFRMQR